jgi:methyl-accepting chemotaxis protein
MNALHRLKLTHRFIVLIALFSCGFVLYGGWSFKTLDELKVNGPVYQRIVQGKDLIADVLPPPEYIIESYLVTLQLEKATDKSEQSALVDRLVALKKDYDSRHVYWEKESLEPELAQTLLEKAHQPALSFYAIAFDQFIPALQSNDRDAVVAAAARLKQAYEIHRSAIDQVVQLTTKRNEVDEAGARDRIQTATVLSAVIFLGSLVVSFVVATIIARGLIRALGGEPSYAMEVAGRIAAGDLKTKIDVKAGDGQSLLAAMKTMQETLAKTVYDIKSAVESVSSGAQQIAAGNEDLSQRTVEQSTSIDESSTSMDRLTAAVRQNTENSRQANQLANTASEVARKGGELVADVVTTMGEINASSKKIVDITGVIDGIAFQTNILALNAAVEAARAGEEGRGFAVVASEVRMLAHRSAMAAKEIKQLIDDSVIKVNQGEQLVERAGATMNEIVVSVNRVTGIINEISAASEEQASGIEQINASMHLMDEMTQQNAALVEEAAAAAASLEQQADMLARSVESFSIAEAGILSRMPAPDSAVRHQLVSDSSAAGRETNRKVAAGRLVVVRS